MHGLLRLRQLGPLLRLRQALVLLLRLRQVIVPLTQVRQVSNLEPLLQLHQASVDLTYMRQVSAPLLQARQKLKFGLLPLATRGPPASAALGPPPAVARSRTRICADGRRGRRQL